MQPTALLERTTGKDTSKNLKFNFLENTTVLFNDWLRNLFLHFLPPLNNRNGFPNGYLTFDIFNNKTFLGTIQKKDEK